MSSDLSPANGARFDAEPADHWLIAATFCYLALPHALFAAGWLDIRAGIAYGAALTVGAVLLFRYLFVSPGLPVETTATPWSWSLLIVLVVLSVGWTALSGIGGIGYQNSDWDAHNGVLMHLIDEDTPLVLLDRDGRPFYLVYYIAYYLPAAAIGRLLGWEAANYGLFVWSVLGVLLSMTWIVRLVQVSNGLVRLGAAVLIFAGFGGLDAIGRYVLGGGWPEPGMHIEWWSYPLFQYSSQSTLLFWVPQHAIPAWLLAAVVLFFGWARLPIGYLGPFAAMSLSWAPFAAVGIVPFLFLALVAEVWRAGWKAPLSISNLVVAPEIFAVTAAFLLANTFSFPVGWNSTLDGAFLRRYGLFLLLEVLVFALPALWLAASRPDRHRMLPWLIMAIGVLSALPLVRMGYYNDLAMRSSIPALFVLIVFVARGVVQPGGGASWVPRVVICLALLVGVQTGASEIARSLADYGAAPPDPRRVSPFTRLHPETVAQRRGDSDAFFFTHLAAKDRDDRRHPRGRGEQ